MSSSNQPEAIVVPTRNPIKVAFLCVPFRRLFALILFLLIGCYFTIGAEDKTIGLTVIFCVLIGWFFAWSMTYLTYWKTSYIFFKDRVCYKEGFLNTVEKELSYGNITDVVKTANVLQRLLGVASIKLLSPGSSDFAGVIMKDVNKAQLLLENISKLVRKKSGS